ncbi:MAG: hypothetical protein AB8I69_19730 [Anaerolineae bacterium]
MRIKYVTVIVALGLVLVMGTTLSAASQAAGIVRFVIGSGGGRLEQDTYTLNGTIGQSVVGQTNQTPYELCSGFWCGGGSGTGSDREVYLPLVLSD